MVVADTHTYNHTSHAAAAHLPRYIDHDYN
jgi:hypothetical protein